MLSKAEIARAGEVILTGGFYAGSPVKWVSTQWMEICCNNYPDNFQPNELAAMKTHLQARKQGKAQELKIAKSVIVRTHDRFVAEQNASKR